MRAPRETTPWYRRQSQGASVDSAVYGRSAAWTNDLTAATKLYLGKSSGAALRAWYRTVVFRTREEKLI